MRKSLNKSDTVTNAIYDAGYNSNSRFYETSNGALGMTPSSYRKGGEGAEEVVAETKLQREKGYLYFIDKDGDLARAPRKGKSDAPSSS